MPKAAATRRPSPDPRYSYYVVMIDHGRLGLEANVCPEITRREVISRLVTREYTDVVFIHAVEDGRVEDVTLELQLEASSVMEAA